MVPNDFELLGSLTKPLAGKGFATDADAKRAVAIWLQTLDTAGMVDNVRSVSIEGFRLCNVALKVHMVINVCGISECVGWNS
jgi:hypothetical protein